MSIEPGICKDKNPTASSLFGVAALQILVGAFGWYLYSANFSLVDWIIAFGGVIYIVLGIVARWKPLFAALTGTVLYALFLAFQAMRSIELLKSGLIIKIPIVILLIVAVIDALKRSSATPQTK
ncbi:MAG TPA: hypothetical protein VK840_03645 [Candidatus Dormibacteraeota bacterium]|jgi:hypothetical protein|nr:hypothetical protein [Candidatus Dormibacteraeota bacterium]